MSLSSKIPNLSQGKGQNSTKTKNMKTFEQNVLPYFLQLVAFGERGKFVIRQLERKFEGGLHDLAGHCRGTVSAYNWGNFGRILNFLHTNVE